MFLGLITVLFGIAFATAEEESSSAPQCNFNSCQEKAKSYLSEIQAPGFHLICIGKQSQPEGLRITAWKNGIDDKIEFVSATSLLALRFALEEHLDLNSLGTDPPAKYPWEMFASTGEKVTDLNAATSQLIFVFKGGRFLWPGVKIGHQQTVKVRDLGEVTLTTASLQPLIFTTQNFLTEEECKTIVEAAEPSMYESPVSLHDADIGKPATEWRTSTQTWLHSKNIPALGNVEERVADLTNIPIENQETLQVLRYKLTQFYDAHHDYFNPALYQKSNLLEGLEGGRNNRMVTVFFYLTDVEEGGETVFPRFGNYRGNVDFKSCERGLRIKPEKGKVAIFYSMLPDGQFDDNSLHGACPVKSGLKWAANKWIWTAPKH